MITLSNDWIWTAVAVALAAGVGLLLVFRRISGTRAIGAVLAIPALLYAALLNASWSARLDGAGVKVDAPFSLTRQSGAIAWSDVQSVRLVQSGVRRPFWHLEIAGDGKTLALPVQSLGRDQIQPFVELVLSRSEASAQDAAAVRAQLPFAVGRASLTPSVRLAGDL
ncbi:MAG TPA: hypothetical protein VGS12_06050 [Caulobacteraceae bacterium]|nr:hypothetical protein [Caulobacteraceae bacterium]